MGAILLNALISEWPLLVCVFVFLVIVVSANAICQAKRKKIFLISPVRSSTPENLEKIKKYVAQLEEKGYRVFWPMRDNPHQKTDPVGTVICDKNFREIFGAGEIHVWLAADSIGSHFDIGGVYMLVRILGLKKKIVFANREEFIKEIGKPGKSFPKLLDSLEKQTEGRQQ